MSASVNGDRALIAILLALVFLLAPATTAAASQVSGDFNGDGRDDLAVGVPNEDVGTSAPSGQNGGAVNVIYGGDPALGSTGNQFWHQDVSGVLGAISDEDNFGSALATGDFDGDGIDDLAVGVPDDTLGGPELACAGSVNVIYGTEGPGLTTTGNQIWNQDRRGIADDAANCDHFGNAVAAGDFDGDLVDDLAVGVRSEALQTGPTAARVGAVNVIYGTQDIGLTAAGDQIWHQDSSGIAETAEQSNNFGWSVGAADFNGDGNEDLAVGVPFESVGSIASAGAVNLIYGSDPAGLSATGDQIWHQDIAGVLETAESNDNLGLSLGVGDFDGGGVDDLAVGVPKETAGSGPFGPPNAGAVNVLAGSEGAGLSTAGNQLWHQGSPGVGRTPAEVDRFGFSLSAGDYDGDEADDLAVGVPREDLPESVPDLCDVCDVGALNVLYSDPGDGLTATGVQHWHQDSDGIAESAGADDQFGYALSAGDFDGDLVDDLAVGVPQEDVGTTPINEAGALNVLYGGAGLGASGDQLWHQDSPGIFESAQGADAFGGALSGSTFIGLFY